MLVYTRGGGRKVLGLTLNKSAYNKSSILNSIFSDFYI